MDDFLFIIYGSLGIGALYGIMTVLREIANTLKEINKTIKKK